MGLIGLHVYFNSTQLDGVKAVCNTLNSFLTSEAGSICLLQAAGNTSTIKLQYVPVHGAGWLCLVALYIYAVLRKSKHFEDTVLILDKSTTSYDLRKLTKQANHNKGKTSPPLCWANICCVKYHIATAVLALTLSCIPYPPSFRHRVQVVYCGDTRPRCCLVPFIII